MQPHARTPATPPPAASPQGPPAAARPQLGQQQVWRAGVGSGAAFLSRARLGAGLGTANRGRQQHPQKDDTTTACRSEPDKDEAFVEESGIKLFHPTPRPTPVRPAPGPVLVTPNELQNHHEDEDEDDDEDDEEDPLYELDVLDDTIVEEGEDEDEEEDEGEEEEEEEEKEEEESEKVKDEVKKGEVEVVKEGNVAPQQPPQQEGDGGVGDGVRNSSASSGLGSSSSSSNKSNGSVCSSASTASTASGGAGAGGTNGSSVVGGAVTGGGVGGKRDSCSSSGSSSRDSGVGESWPLPDPFVRSRPHRLSLPTPGAAAAAAAAASAAASAVRPRHKFTIKRVAEAETTPARRTSDYIDPRLAERRTGDATPTQQRPHQPVWLRRLSAVSVLGAWAGYCTGKGLCKFDSVVRSWGGALCRTCEKLNDRRKSLQI